MTTGRCMRCGAIMPGLPTPKQIEENAVEARRAIIIAEFETTRKKIRAMIAARMIAKGMS